jgi:hypothetical protein
MLDTPTLITDSMLETVIITDNIWKDVADGKMTPEEASEIIAAILEDEKGTQG